MLNRGEGEFVRRINRIEKWLRRLESIIVRPSGSGTLHADVTVADTVTIDMHIVGQQISADAILDGGIFPADAAGVLTNDGAGGLSWGAGGTGGGDGWTAITGTFTYAGPTTINVSSGAASIYSVGYKIRYQNNDSGTWLYDYVVGIADTLLTVAGDAVPNATLTDMSYSNAANPLGFPQWFPWVPVLTGGAADLPSYTVARFSLSGRTCHISFAAENKTLTGSAGQIQITLPITGIATINHWPSGVAFTGAAYVHIRVTLNTTYLNVYKDITNANWAGNESGQYIYISGFYEI
jgi:hypothetical protein